MKKAQIAILFSLLLAYLLFATIIQLLSVASYYTTLINPISWFVIALIAYYFIGDERKSKKQNDKFQIVIIVVLTYLIIYFLSGLFLGYVNSPYSQSIINIVKNSWCYILIIPLQEFVRSSLVRQVKKSYIFYILITIIFIAFEISFYNFNQNFISGETLFKYIFQVIIPAVCRNALFTYLCIISGYKTVLAYRIPVEVAKIILPIYPNIDWFISAISNIFLPFITFTFVSYFQSKVVVRIPNSKIKRDKPIGSIIFLIILSLLICFISGVFTLKPVSIVSNSMYPIISRGDVVIVERLLPTEIRSLEVGQIIQYRLDNKMIVHRIVDIETKENKSLLFITKGDNNNSIDVEKVTEDKIVGIVKFKIPKIGFPSVWLNDFFDKTTPNVDLG